MLRPAGIHGLRQPSPISFSRAETDGTTRQNSPCQDLFQQAVPVSSPLLISNSIGELHTRGEEGSLGQARPGSERSIL